MNLSKCEQIMDQTCESNHLKEACILVENHDGSFSWNHGYHRTVDSPMNMASITKLFATTCVLQLIEQKKMSLSDKISDYLGNDIVKGLHVYKRTDYSQELTISHLLFQNSGLPDYFFSKTPDGKAFGDRLQDQDFTLTFDEMIATCKAMKPIFKPGNINKSNYADINFDILGHIIELVYGMDLYKVYEKQIFEPLGLVHTYAVSEEKNHSPLVYVKGKALDITNYLRSCPASGGGVTTAKELMIFLKAFFSGDLFSKDLLQDLQRHQKIQWYYGCIEYAGGHMYIHASYPFQKKNTLRGHSGSSGSFAYRCEETGLYFVGDLNDSRSYIPVNMLLKIENNMR